MASCQTRRSTTIFKNFNVAVDASVEVAVEVLRRSLSHRSVRQPRGFKTTRGTFKWTLTLSCTFKEIVEMNVKIYVEVEVPENDEEDGMWTVCPRGVISLRTHEVRSP